MRAQKKTTSKFSEQLYVVSAPKKQAAVTAPTNANQAKKSQAPVSGSSAKDGWAAKNTSTVKGAAASLPTRQAGGSTRAAMNRALTELASPPANNPYGQYVDSVRKELSAAGLPTSARHVRSVVVDSEEAHGSAVARTLAGPVGLGQGSEGHFTLSATRKDANGNTKIDQNAMASQAVSRLGLDPATASRLKSGAELLDLNASGLAKLKVGSIDDAANIGMNMAELDIQSKRSELSRVKTDIVKGDTSKPTVVNMSMGLTQLQIAEGAATATIAKSKLDPKGALSTELKSALKLRPNEQPSESDVTALAILIAEKMDKKMSDPKASAGVNSAKKALASDLDSAAKKDRIMLVTSAGNHADDIAAANNSFKDSTHPQAAEFKDRAQLKWSGNVTNDVPGMFVVGATTLGDAKKIGDEKVADFSSTGQNLTAPGVGVPVNVPQKSEDVKLPKAADGKPFPVGGDGTSYAAPHVAGVVALMLEVNPKLSQNQVQSILQNTSKAMGSPLNGQKEAGKVIDPAAAVKQAAELKAAATVSG